MYDNYYLIREIGWFNGIRIQEFLSVTFQDMRHKI